MKATVCAILQSMSFVQHEALTDVTGMVTDLINTDEAIEGVRITWLGAAVHAEVGEYEIVANVTFADRSTRCYTTLIEVTDTDECSPLVPADWRHACDASARCVNTVGSYACVCDEGSFAPRDAPHGCAGRRNSTECCPRSHKKINECVAGFTCEGDLCDDKCVEAASCARSVAEVTPGRFEASYACSCPEEFIGSGERCLDDAPSSVFVDGRGRPTRGLPCGCQVGVLDPCWEVECDANAACVAGVCVCDAGFTYKDGQCVDETIPEQTRPELTLRGPASVELTQCGEVYHELGVRIVDENAEAYERSLRVAYSKARDFPSRRKGDGAPFFKLGDYQVTYRIDTPWTSPPFVETLRRVRVVDEDECSLPTGHNCSSRCVPEARCVNEPGGYRCECPSGYKGDGFPSLEIPDYWLLGRAEDNADAWRIPETFAGGTGCVDVTPPELRLLGPNPRVLRLERCDQVTLLSRFGGAKPTDQFSDAFLQATDVQVADLAARAPHVLCDQLPSCAEASDLGPLPGQTVDLSHRVSVGAPARVEADATTLVYNVPYSVTDDAGNTATTHRRLVLKLLSLGDDVVADAPSEGGRDDENVTKQEQQDCPPCEPCEPQFHDAPEEKSLARLRADNAELEIQYAALRTRVFVYGVLCAFAVVVAIIAVYVAMDASTTTTVPTPVAKRNDAQRQPPNSAPVTSTTTPLAARQLYAPISGAAASSSARLTPTSDSLRLPASDSLRLRSSPAASYATPVTNAVRATPRSSPWS